MTRTTLRWLGEPEIEALRHILLQFVQHVAVAFADCRCTIQLFENPDTLRTVVASDLPLGVLGQSSFPVGVGIAGWAAQAGVPLLVHDVTTDPRFLSMGRESGGTMMCVPMTDGTTDYGTMTAWAPKAGSFHSGSLAIFRAYAQGAAIAIAQAHRAIVQEATAHRATMLLGLTRAVTAYEDPRQALDIVMPFVRNVVPHSVGMLVMETEGRSPEVRVFARTLQTTSQSAPLHAWALDAYARQQDRTAHSRSFAPITDIVDGHMVYAAPLRAAGNLLGLACYFHTEPFGPETQQTLQDCSSVIGTAVYNAVLFRQMLLGKERFEAVFASTVDGILVLDEAGATALDANKAFYRLTKIDPATVRLSAPVAKLESAWVDSSVDAESGDPSILRRWHLAPDATRDRYLEVTESAIVIGGVPHRLRVFHDATAMRRVEQTRAEFMGVVSHELRSPLTSIYGFLNILSQSRSGSLSAKQRECVDSASLSVRQLWRLVDDINDLVQSDLGRLALRWEPVQIGDLIQGVIATMDPLMYRAPARVVAEIDPTLPVTMADPARVRQILNNLLANAMKFSEPETAVHACAGVRDGMIEIRVTDSGPGIPAEDAERIFERFVKGTSTPQQDASGLGLGLAVVRQLVASHGGRVWVESAPAQGSVFVFTLPIAPPDNL